MSFTLIFLAFFAGILTLLSPCILPLLPVILSWVLDKNGKRFSIFVAILSLGVSIFLFTFLLKVLTLFINIPTYIWTGISWFLLLFLGISFLLPWVWVYISNKVWLSSVSHKIMIQSDKQSSYFKEILLWAALWPLFSSCSPSYIFILAIVIPQSFVYGIFLLISYILGIILILWSIAIFWKKILTSYKGFLHYEVLIKKILWVILIFTAIFFISGVSQSIQSTLSIYFPSTSLENSLLKKYKAWLESSESIGTCGAKWCSQNIEWGLWFLDPQVLLDKYGKYKAPEIQNTWEGINIDNFWGIDDLKGKVILLKFWRIGCPNCIEELGEIEKIEKNYLWKNFSVFSIHIPENPSERKKSEVEKVVKKYNITYPVLLDNDYLNWKTYHNTLTPTYFLIDPAWYVVKVYEGKWHISEIKKDIENLF